MGGEGRTRLETARMLGIRFRVTPKHSIEDRIENTRNVLPLCWFDSKKCKLLLDALRAYRKEPEKEKLWADPGRPLYKDHAVHDWACHGADAFGYMAWWYRKDKLRIRQEQKQAVDDFEYV
jgi:hypothetical protein